jgi:hypothetical protein
MSDCTDLAALSVIYTELRVESPPGTTLAPQPPINVTHTVGGIRGAPGPAGAPGTAVGGDKNYVHDQATASDTWVVVHMLGKYPSVVVVDSAGSVWEGGVTYTDLDHLTITFTFAFAGKAYLN